MRFELPIPRSQIIHMYNSPRSLSKPFPFINQSITYPHADSSIYEELEASTAAALFASATLFTSPCLPFCIDIHQPSPMYFSVHAIPAFHPCGGQGHSHSTSQISAPSLLFAQQPISGHLSSCGERLVRRWRGTYCSYSSTCQSSLFLLRHSQLKPEGVTDWRQTYVRPDAFHANAIVYVSGL